MPSDPFANLLGAGRSGGVANRRPDRPCFDIIYEEREPLFNAIYFTGEEAADERGYTLEEVTVSDEWLRPVALSAAEVRDEDAMHDLDPDWEPGDPKPDWQLVRCPPEHPLAIRFLRVRPKASQQPA